MVSLDRVMCKISPDNYRETIIDGGEVAVEFKLFNLDSESTVIKLTHRFLENHDLLYLKDPIFTILKELINNAVKANLKRLYFSLKGLDINNAADYSLGMKTFKYDTYLCKDKQIFDKLSKSDMSVKVTFKTDEQNLYLIIYNSSDILISELQKINSRLLKAREYADISDAFDDILDDAEGAGLGLIMAMMLFKNCGLPETAFRYEKFQNGTAAVISVPRKIPKPESDLRIAEEILNEIREIPAFPGNIREIQKLCSDPKCSLKRIAERIARDPGLTASVIRLANSAGYFTPNKALTIEASVAKLGINGVNSLLIASGVHYIMESRYKKFEQVWKNSEKRAFYAKMIAMLIKQFKIIDYVYLSALLADIGKIVMFAVNPSLLKKLVEISGFKGVDDINILEEIGLGLSHSVLGGLIVKKWEFDDILVKAIEYHHRPHLAPAELRDIIYIVYLAEAMVEFDNKHFKYESFDEDVLSYFNIDSREKFDDLHKKLMDAYISHIKYLIS